ASARSAQDCVASVVSSSKVSLALSRPKDLHNTWIKISTAGQVATLDYYKGSVVALNNEYFQLKSDPFLMFVHDPDSPN
ncbi:MAG: hypothetical protein AB7O59_25220, partial [Pirellulales bacterium]